MHRGRTWQVNYGNDLLVQMLSTEFSFYTGVRDNAAAFLLHILSSDDDVYVPLIAPPMC